jgi:hypothetical protein
VTSTKDTAVPAAPPGEAEAPIDQYQAIDLKDLTPEQRKVFEKLTAPFRPDEIETLPKPFKESKPGNCQVCGGYHGLPASHLSYVGHAGMTMRLVEIDPTWSWEALHPDIDPRALAALFQNPNLTAEAMRAALDWLAKHSPPKIEDNGGIWIRLHVAGFTAVGFGDAEGKVSAPRDMKVMIGDAIRNAAMRLGSGTYLWSKSEKAAAILARAGQADEERTRQEDNVRQELPKGRPAQRAKGTQAKAQAQEDPWKVIPLRPSGKTLLDQLVNARDVEEASALYRKVLAEGRASGPQHVTRDDVLEVTKTEDAAGWLGMLGPFELLEFATAVGKHLADEGIGIMRRVEDLAEAPTPAAASYQGDTGLPGEGGEQS